MGTDWSTWRSATEQALYEASPASSGIHTDWTVSDRGEGLGFFVREAPAAHFRTSVHASPLFATAVARLLRRVDKALGRPGELALVDVGAGRGELLAGVLDALPDETARRVRPCGVERAPRPAGLDARVEWLPDVPRGGLEGLLFANEWLDNVPVDVAEVGEDGVPRTVLVRAADGAERLGGPLPAEDAAWLARWWPLGGEAGDAGRRAELGRPRDEAWARAVAALDRGLAVAVDYAHTRATRPPYGSLTGYLDGREVRPVPDGSRDITSHVALDACAAAGAQLHGSGHGSGQGSDHGSGVASAPALLPQREALHALGVSGGRPPLALASSDPAGYVRALSSASDAATLTDPAGLGGFTWLIQPVGGVRSPFG